MARKWVLVLLSTVLAAVRTGARPDGAPTSACDTFTPSHDPSTAQSGDGGYKLYSDLIDNGGNYEAGQEYNITLRHQDGTTAFQGFMIGARGATLASLKVGSFSTGTDAKLLDCGTSTLSDTSTVTHTSSSSKQSVMLTWTAPSLGSGGTVKFRYAVAKTMATFYADLELPMVTQPVPSFSFQIPSTFTIINPQPTPAVMVPECPATDKTADSEFPLTFGQPAGCDRQSCDLYAAMGPNSANADFLDIYLEGTAEGWVAVGFSKNKFMNNTDVVGCRISSGNVIVRDAWNPSQINQDDEFPEIGVCSHSTSYSGGRISCLISKYGMKVEDTQDFNLKNGSYWIITGIRAGGQNLNGRFFKHSSMPTFSTEPYNPFSDSNADVVVTTEPPIVCPAAPGADQDYNIEVGIPSGCTKDDCTYYVAMGPNAEDGEFLDLYLQGTVEGWVAVGFSLDQLMMSSDVLGCKVVNGTAAVVDTWNLQAPKINALDGDQEGVCVHSADYINGVISCSFSRHGSPGSDSDDLQLNADLWLFFGAKTDGQAAAFPGFGKHTATPIISGQMYNPFTSEMVTLSPTMATDAPVTCPSAPNQDYNLEFGLPPGCIKDDCEYYVAMGPNAEDDEFLDVYLQGTAEGWVAVGFSHTEFMGDSDVLGCKVANGVVSVVDTWNTQTYNMLDSDQEGVCVHSTDYTNGVISCSFSRLGGDGSNNDDLRLNDDLWLMFGSRTTAQAAPILTQHSSTPVLSDKEYNPFTSERKISPPSMSCPSAPASDAVYPVEITFNNDFSFEARINDENPNYLDIIIQAASEGWIAIGFSTTRQMAETDVFGCQVESTGSVVNVKDSWNPLPNYFANQLDSTQEGICLHDAAYNGGTIRCEFSRYIAALDSEMDLNLNQSLYRIYGKGNTRGSAGSSLARHESTPAVTDNTANVVAAAASGENIEDSSVFPREELIKTHGIFMLFSWPLLATNAIFFASWLKPALPNGEWFQVHRAVMVVSLLTAVSGFIMAFVANAKRSVPGLIEFDPSGVNTTHFVFGIALMLLHIINPLIALFRCKPGAKWRWIFNLSHAGIIGFGAQALALVNVCLGLWLVDQSHYGFYVFVVFVVLFIVMEVSMFILTSLLATSGNVPKEEIPNLVHSSVKFCLPKSAKQAPDTTRKDDIEMKEKSEKPSADEYSGEKKKKKPSSDARIRWVSFGIFLGISVIVSIVVAILVIVDLE